MLIPLIIHPQVLVPKGSELDAEREVACLCHKQIALGHCRLVWADFGDGWGWRALCSQSCYVAAFKEGEA